MFFDFFFDKILEERQSPYNGEIKVIEFQGQKKLIANNLMQSGNWIKKMWEKPIKHIVGNKESYSLQINNILLLGLGGGTLLSVLKKHWLDALVTAVEIDQNMVDLANKYFEVDRYEANIVVDDAFSWVRTFPKVVTNTGSVNTNRYDLIIVDLFCGDCVNPGINNKIFLENCFQLLSPQGIFLTNLLFYGKHKDIAEEYIKKIEKITPEIQLIRHRWNLFVVARI